MTKPAFADIGACVFDAYGTLFDVHSAVGRSGGALGDRAGPVSAKNSTMTMDTISYNSVDAFIRCLSWDF